MIEYRRATALLLALVALLAVPVGPAAAERAVEDASATVPTRWTLSGGGFGHAVGMSQYGAQQLATEGRSAREILAYYYAGTTYDAVPDTARVSVNLQRGVSSVDLAGSPLAAGGGTLTLTVGGGQVRVPAGTTAKVARSGSGVSVACAGCTPSSAWGADVTVTLDRSRTTLLVGGQRYDTGDLRVSPTPSASTLNASLRVRLHDEYLDQVAEMPWSWRPAALQAQAAAARAYALRKLSGGLRASCDCHLLDDTGDQVFAPTPAGDPAWPAWRAAVRATGSSTTGYVPRYQGRVIEALYSSSTGGWTIDNEDVFGGAPVPYLRGRYDRPSLSATNPRRAWTKEVSGSALAAAFGLGDVARLDLSSRDSGHGVRTAVATDSAGRTSTLTGTALRRSLGLSSTQVWRAGRRTAGTGPSALAAAVARGRYPRARTVVLTSAYPSDLAHLLVAQPIARAHGAPLLLTGRSTLPRATVAELDRRGGAVTQAVVVGGPGVVGDDVVARLEARGITVTRVGGDTLDTVGAGAVDAVTARRPVSEVVVGCARRADELAPASALGADLGLPVALCGYGSQGASIPWRVRSALRRSGITSAVVVGPASSVPDTVLTELRAMGITPRRVAGSDPAGTAAALARTSAGRLGSSEVVVAAWRRPVEVALAGGRGSAVLLADRSSLPAASVEALQRTPAWETVRVVGDADAVDDTVLRAGREA